MEKEERRLKDGKEKVQGGTEASATVHEAREAQRWVKEMARHLGVTGEECSLCTPTVGVFKAVACWGGKNAVK